MSIFIHNNNKKSSTLQTPNFCSPFSPLTMKKLYRKGTVHPSPSPPPPTISDHLSFLPAAILTLTLSLSPEDREVLAYLISCSCSSSSSSGNPRRNRKVTVSGDHPPLFNCSCFRCYMSYWVRWNNSSNHQLIHEIIDAFEDSLAHTTKPSRKDKRNKRGSTSKTNPSELNRSEFPSSPPESVPESSSSGAAGEVEVGHGDDEGEDDEEKGSVRRFVSFIGERIWGAWGQ